jgi:DNA-binding PadR family transcriptional regulator
VLDEQQEQSGRRRKVYRLTETGQAELDAWRAEPVGEPFELRDPGLLKLFFGADSRRLAQAQLAIHEQQLETYLEQAEMEMPAAHRLALECGIGHEREYIRSWKKLAG